MAQDYLSTDPAAGEDYLSTDPNAGQPLRGQKPRTWGDTLTDVGIGAAKGLGNTVTGLGEMFYRYVPGVSALSDAAQRADFGDVIPGEKLFGQARQDLQPTNTPQRVGFMGEQIGEFFSPTGAVSRAAKAAMSGGLTLAQSGGKADAALSAGITAVLPGGRATQKAASALKTSAQKTEAQALGATKEWAKSDAAKLAPEMLRRGVRGSREAMLEQAKGQVAAVGTKIGAAVDDAAKAGVTVNGLAARGELQLARDALMVHGSKTPIPGTESVVRTLDKLEQFVGTLGDDIPIEQAQHVKQVWDRIVSKAGLFGPKATASSTDNGKAWATREAAGAFRTLLADASPDLAKLNREFKFWKGLDNVLSATKLRTQAQGGGLVAGATGGAGMVAGMATGDGLMDKAENAVLYGLAGRQLVRLFQSPTWRTTVSAPLKNKLADALASGNAQRVERVVGQITASLPAQVGRPSPAY